MGKEDKNAMLIKLLETTCDTIITHEKKVMLGVTCSIKELADPAMMLKLKERMAISRHNSEVEVMAVLSTISENDKDKMFSAMLLTEGLETIVAAQRDALAEQGIDSDKEMEAMLKEAGVTLPDGE